MNKVSNYLVGILIASFFVLAGCNLQSSNPVPPGGIGPVAVNLGTAGNFAILTESGITTDSTIPLSLVVGDIGVSPITYAGISGFYLTPTVPTVDTTFATSPLVVGKVYAADYVGEGGITPIMLTKAIGDKGIAYLDAAGRTPIVLNTDLYAGSIGGQTFGPGLYTWTTPVVIGSSITLDGGSNDTWIFQIAGSLSIGPGVSVTLSGGAMAKNIVWQVADTVSLNTTATLNGIVLTGPAKSITLNAGAIVNGRLLAGGAVTMISGTITQP